MNKIYNIAISCIGSGVGQSVINSCRLSRLPIKTFGFGTNPFAYGLYDCDEYIYTPNIYEKDYVDRLIKICIDNKIDLIVPGMDDEAHIFSKSIEQFNNANIKVIVAGERLLDICRDKEKMSTELNKVSNIFVRSYDKEQFLIALKNSEITLPVIAKPRSGFASRGVYIINTLDDIDKINDTHIIQELAIPHVNDPERKFYDAQLKKNINPQVSEISIQLVADKKGAIIGRMISYNKLNNGIPIEIIPYENELIWNEIEKFYPTFKEIGLYGPFNLQGRLTDNGLKLFELNARFTGITGLRAYMGFNEVEACIADWLEIKDNKSISLKLNYNKFGIRQTADKAISKFNNKEVKSISELINKGSFISDTKTLLLTGATGYFGRNLIDEISRNNTGVIVWALVRNKEEAKKILPDTVVLYDVEDLNDGTLSLGNIDILLHAGFARPHKSQIEISDSLLYTANLFERAVANQVPEIINISSQSVYGQETLPPWKETATIAPESMYASAKYSSELLLESLAKQHNQIKFTSIRVGAISGGAKGLVENDLLSKLTKKALHSEDINIVGGNQIVECIDIRDVVDGLISIIKDKRDVKWKPVYNLGSSNQIKLIDLATQIVNVASDNKHIPKSQINIEEKEINQKFGLDSSLFEADFGWSSKYSIKETIESLVKYFN